MLDRLQEQIEIAGTKRLQDKVCLPGRRRQDKKGTRAHRFPIQKPHFLAALLPRTNERYVNSPLSDGTARRRQNASDGPMIDWE